MTSQNQAIKGMRRNLTRLASGTIISQVLMVASTPVLTRIYAPDAYGVMAVFSSIYVIAIPLTTMKYDAALILPKSGKSAAEITALVVLIASALTALAGLIAMVGHIMSWFALPGGPLWLPLALWLGAMYTLTQQWSARRSNYIDYARSQVVGSAVNVGASCILGLTLGGDPQYLVIAFVCGMASSLLTMCLGRGGALLDAPPMRFFSLVHRAQVYRQFPALVLPTTLIMTAGQSSIPLILAMFYPIKDVGQFAVANRLLLVPAVLIGGAVSEAFRAEFVRRQRVREASATLFISMLRALALIALPLFGIIAVVVPDLLPWVFGAAYNESGNIAIALLLGVASQFVGNPFASVFVAQRKTALGLRVQTLTAVAPLAFLLFAAGVGAPLNAALGLYSVASAISIALMLFFVHRLCQTSDGALLHRRTP